MSLPHGDYTDLAAEYARHRPGYGPGVPGALAEFATGAGGVAPLDVVDVGAGTGIWTRMLARLGCNTTAVEPNDAMRTHGRRGNGGLAIHWCAGTAEQTGLAQGACDLLTMASSFHWADFELASAEFVRVLRPGGVFAALWNTRRVELNPLLVEIEELLQRMVPGLERMSSGRSRFCEGLLERLAASGVFTDVGYLEEQHVERMTPERYLGIWRSVNDVRVQAGETVFARFLDHVRQRTADLDSVDATYVTRVWDRAHPRGGRRMSGGLEAAVVYWITGVAGVGKSTLGRLFSEELRSVGRSVVFLDGDELRTRLFPGAGYAPEERLVLARRYAELCALVSAQGVDVVCATISLFPEIWERNRREFASYREILVQAPIEVLMQRRRSLWGADAAQSFVVGKDAPAEEPPHPDVRLQNDGTRTPQEVVRELRVQLSAAEGSAKGGVQ